MSKQVKFKTNKGDILIELNEEKAPITVANFVKYVEDGHFNSTIFHRVIPNFVIQGGGMQEGMKEKETRAPIAIESQNGLKNLRGSLSMARTNDPNSATSQFFINLVDNAFLDYQGPSQPGYAVFAKVTEGMDVVDEIAKVQTGSHGFHDDVPKTPIIVESAEFI